MNIASAIQVAQLALKHRQNKNQQQRIIVFAGRYIVLPSDSLIPLTKEGIVVDI